MRTRPAFCPLEEATRFLLPKGAHKKVLAVIGTHLQHALHNAALAVVAKGEIQVSPLPKETGFRHRFSIRDGREFLILKSGTETDLREALAESLPSS